MTRHRVWITGLGIVSPIGTGRDFILGDTFSMADVIFGGTLRFMVTFNMLEPRPAITSYIERLKLRPALARAEARNAQTVEAHGLKPR